MSRSGYNEDCDDYWEVIRWRGAVTSAIRGRRGQQFLKELLAALDAMPVKRLVDEELVTKDGQVCALGSLGLAKGLDLENVDPYDAERVAAIFNLAPALAREVMFMNDEGVGYWGKETPEQRWQRMRNWVAEQIRKDN